MTSAITGAVVSVVDSSFSPQEKMMKLKRKRERIMSICFTWFPIGGYRRTQYIPELEGFYNVWGIYDIVGILLGGILGGCLF